MEKNANYISVELIEDTLTKDCHLAISVISPSREEHTYVIPVELQDGCFLLIKTHHLLQNC